MPSGESCRWSVEAGMCARQVAVVPHVKMLAKGVRVPHVVLLAKCLR